MSNKETILLLRVQASGSKESSTYLSFDFISESPSLLLPNVQQLAWDLLPGAEEIQATYLDSDGDRCTLTEHTAADALSFATAHEDQQRVLEVHVQDRAEAAKAGYADCASYEQLRSRLATAKREAAEAQTARAAAEQELASSCATLQAEIDAATKRADTAEKSVSELRDAKAELKVQADELARLTTLCDTLRAEVTAARRQAAPVRDNAEVLSATVTESSPLVLGIEAYEDSSKRGDVGQEFEEELKRLGAQQALRLGRMQLAPASGDENKLPLSVPASAKFMVENNGAVQWPDATVLTIMKGDSFGVPLLALGPKAPGESEEVVMDLLVPPKAENTTSCSMWAIVNAATGTPLGPLLVLEVEWRSQ